MIIWS